MAALTYNGTNFDNWIGSAAITSGTNTSNLTTGITSASTTAPNTTNKATGCWIFMNSIPGAGNTLTIALLESGVSKVTAVINFADMQVGFNYVRFGTPYQFTTTGAGAYTVKATTSSTSSGTLRNATSGFWFEITYDSAVSVGSTDDVWVAGFNNSGLTPQTLTLTGVSNLWGSGTDTAVSGAINATMGAGVTVGSGGTLKYDQSASCTLQLRGSVFVTAGGLFDMRPPATKTIVSTLIMDNNVSAAQFGIFTASTNFGGQILTTGATYTQTYTTYVSGVGTAASPLIVGIAWDASVGDEIILGGGTDYSKDETRYIITVNSTTSFVVSSTPGGSETALANTHAAGSYMSNLTRNSVIKPQNTARGYWLQNGSNTATLCSFNYTRLEYSNCASGKGINPNTAQSATFDGLVMWNNDAGGRTSLAIANTTVAQTYNYVTIFNCQGTLFNAQSGIGLGSTSNKTLNWCFGYNAPSTALQCAFLSLSTAFNNTINNCHSYGANAPNIASGYAIGLFTSSTNTFNNCTVNATRTNGLVLSGSTSNTFNSCNFGTIATNTIDVQNIASTLNTAIFNSCNFGSATLIATYTSLLEGSLIGFQELNSSTTGFRWYTPHGKGRAETSIVRTGILSLAIDPEDNTNGFTWSFQTPATPGLQVFVPGFFQRSAGLTGTVTVSLFLPGSTVADNVQTLSVTTGSWLSFLTSANYPSNATPLLATIVINVRGTAGNTIYFDDFFNSGNTVTVNNQIASFEVWYNGQPASIFSLTDVSAIPLQTAQAVWADSNTYTTLEKGGLMQTAADDSELAAFK